MALCTAMLVFNLAFIWGNSMLPAHISAALSGWVKSLLVGAGDIGEGFFESDFSIRKLAHFLEFTSLGALLVWKTGMLKKGTFFRPLWLGAGAALLDECIQFFSPGRAPRVLDWSIDCLGVLLGLGIINSILYFRRKNT